MICKYCEVTLIKDESGNFAVCPSCKRRYAVKKIDPNKPKQCRVCGGELSKCGELWICGSCGKAYKFAQSTPATANTVPTAPKPVASVTAKVESAPTHIAPPTATVNAAATKAHVEPAPAYITPTTAPAAQVRFGTANAFSSNPPTNSLPVNPNTDISLYDLVEEPLPTASTSNDTTNISATDLVEEPLPTANTSNDTTNISVADLVEEPLPAVNSPTEIDLDDLIADGPISAPAPKQVAPKPASVPVNNVKSSPREVPALLDEDGSTFAPMQAFANKKPIIPNPAGRTLHTAAAPNTTIEAKSKTKAIKTKKQKSNNGSSEFGAVRLALAIVLGVLTCICGIFCYIFRAFDLGKIEGLSALSNNISYIHIAFWSLLSLVLILLSVLTKGAKKIGIILCLLFPVLMTVYTVLWNVISQLPAAFATVLVDNNNIILYCIRALLFLGGFLILVLPGKDEATRNVNAFAIMAMVFTAVVVALGFYPSIPFEEWKLTAISGLENYLSNADCLLFSFVSISACVAFNCKVKSAK